MTVCDDSPGANYGDIRREIESLKARQEAESAYDLMPDGDRIRRLVLAHIGCSYYARMLELMSELVDRVKSECTAADSIPSAVNP